MRFRLIQWFQVYDKLCKQVCAMDRYDGVGGFFRFGTTSIQIIVRKCVFGRSIVQCSTCVIQMSYQQFPFNVQQVMWNDVPWIRIQVPKSGCWGGGVGRGSGGGGRTNLPSLSTGRCGFVTHRVDDPVCDKESQMRGAGALRL